MIVTQTWECFLLLPDSTGETRSHVSCKRGWPLDPFTSFWTVPPAILMPTRVKVKGVKVTSSGRKAEGLELG